MWQGRQTAFYYPFVAHNSTAVPQSLGGTATFQPGDLALHPGAGGEISILRWTAPAPGSYSVMAAFRGIDVGPTTTDVHVLRNGVSLFDGAVSALGTGPTYAGVLTVSSGDTIDFAVGYGANHTYLNDSTGLNASLVAVPESVSLVLAGVGVAALAPFIGRRFHRSLEDERM